MFRLNYIIMEHDCSWNSNDLCIHGCVRLDFNEFDYGMIPHFPCDYVYVDKWIVFMLKVVKYLHQSEYVAWHDIETLDCCLEFRQNNKSLDCSLVHFDCSDNQHHEVDYEFFLNPLKCIKKVEWKTSINSKQFVCEIISKASSFIELLGKLHPECMNANNILEIQELLSCLETDK